MTAPPDPFIDVLERDPRYRRGAYEFIFHALAYTVELLGKREEQSEQERHLTGQQLLDGIRRLALEQFGYLAHSVFKAWGVTRTIDWGHIVYNLIDAGMMNKTDDDTIEDFADGYDHEDALEKAYFRDRLYACPRGDDGHVQFPWPTPEDRPHESRGTDTSEQRHADADDADADADDADVDADDADDADDDDADEDVGPFGDIESPDDPDIDPDDIDTNG